MKKSIICVLAMVVALCMAISCQKGNTTKGENAPGETVSKIMLNSEDSMLCMEVLGAYQDYKQSYADSAREKTEMINEDAGEAYLLNQIHVDSVLNECLILVRQRNYDKLLSRLEAERVNFYSHPGNTIDNEIGLNIMFSKLYNQFCESQDSFYTKMLPIYRFTKLHMEALEAFGKERHPFYDHMLKLIEEAEEYVGDTELGEPYNNLPTP